MRELSDLNMQEVMAYEPDFSLLGMIDLEKSTSPENDEKRIVLGEISNTQRDEQGERLMQKSLDFSYFDSNGVIKYEHLPKNSPVNVIGFPHERFTNENSTVIKGALFKNHDMADQTWKMLKAIEQHNKEFPDHQKTVGWSVEGSYGNKRTPTGLVKSAKIVNVVITPNPILKSTYLKLVEQHNAPIFKSLSATPVETEITTKTGGDVIVKDNIDTNVKVTAPGGDIDDKSNDKKKKKLKNDKKNKEDFIMKSFNTYEEAVAHFVELGKSQDEAEELAKSLDLSPAEVEDETGDDIEGLAKDIKEDVGLIKGFMMKLFKSGAGDDDPDPDDDPDADPDADPDDLEKGLIGDDDEVVIDATQFMRELHSITSDIQEKNNSIMKSLESQGDGLEKSLTGVCDMIEKVAGYVENLEKSLTIEGHPIAEAVQVLMKSRSGVSIADMQRFIPKTDGGGQAAEITDAEIGNYSELHAKLEKGVSEKKINLNEMAKAETSFRLRDFITIKTILDKCS